MCIIQSTTIIEKSKQYFNILKVYKRIKEVGELTLGDLTVTPSPGAPNEDIVQNHLT